MIMRRALTKGVSESIEKRIENILLLGSDKTEGEEDGMMKSFHIAPDHVFEVQLYFAFRSLILTYQ